MCYSRALPETLNFNCDICDKPMQTQMYSSSYNYIYERVNEIRKLGYDVKVEDLCLDCMIKKVTSGEYYCNLSTFEFSLDVATKWDNNLKDYKLEKLTDAEIIKRLRLKNATKPFICFYFRTSPDEKYHMSQMNNTYCYRIVKDFLNIEQSCDTRLLNNEIELIERMTGLKLD